MKVVSGMALALWPSDASDVCSMPRRNLCSSCLFSGLFSKALFNALAMYMPLAKNTTFSWWVLQPPPPVLTIT